MMLKLRDLSIQAKLKFLTLVISGGALLVACGVFLVHDGYAMRELYSEQLRITAGMIGSASTAAISFKDPAAAKEILQSLTNNASIVQAEIRTVEGASFARYVRVPSAGSEPPAEAVSLADTHRFDGDRLILTRSIHLEGQVIGRVVLEEDLGELRARSRRYAGTVAIVLLVSGLVAFLMSNWLLRVISGPISQVADVARRVSTDKDYTLRVPKTSNDELGQLVDGFNEMLSQIQTRDKALEDHRDHLEEQVSDRTRTLTVLNDELRELNAKLSTARERAEAGARAKSLFLANMSHEIRTPMNGVLGMAQLLRDSKMSAGQSTLLTKLSQSAHALVTILNDILDFSKIEAGKLTLEHSEFVLRETLSVAVDSVALAAREKRLALISRVHPEVPDSLLGDAGRLRQVLLNLVGNAVKFTERGEILTTVAVESMSSQAVTLHFSVKDSGIGIPTDLHEAIFHPFEQADGTTTRRHGGTGLGLTIASQLIELMGGRIWVESEVGLGSTFHFTARLDLGSEGTQRTSAVEERQLASTRVLVVEANVTQCDVLAEILTSWGLEVKKATESREALALLAKQHREGHAFHVAVIDAELPDIDGFSLADQVEQVPGMVGGMVLMLPSSGILERSGRHPRPGIRSYVTKPINPSDLLSALLIATGLRQGETADSKGPGKAVAPSSGRKFSILVAEDNPVNQEFIQVALTNKGHSVTIVESGALAISALQLGSFDVVLMDLSMPVMGGLEATAAIRRNEVGRERRQPIIALTAHALKGDRERCLAAGMDEYITKPIDLDQLLACIERLLGPAVAAPDADHGAEKPAAPGPAPSDVGQPSAADALQLQPAALLARFGDNPQIARKVVDVFLAESPAMVARVVAAAAQKDGPALAQAAHRLRSGTMFFGFQPLDQAALALETAGESDQVAHVQETVAVLESSYQQVVVALRAIDFAKMP